MRLLVSGALMLGLCVSGASVVSAEAQTPSASAALTARLAVLRRPQTPADALPSGVRLPHEGQGTIVPSLTRLVATPAGASLYLAVFTPAHGSPPFWSTRLGDQVGLVSVTARGAQIGGPVPAAELADGNRVTVVGPGTRSSGGLSSDYQVGVVPDGVARVVWTFADARRRHRYVVDGDPANNIVIVPFHEASPFLLHATWYSADGSRISTSDRALRRATAARQRVLRRTIGP